jgi:signal transduction histidine kinase
MSGNGVVNGIGQGHGNGSRRRATLLLVDDESEVLRSLYDLFRLEYRVLTASRGEEALEILRSDEPIQVVMSDQRMPGMTGVGLLNHARSLRPEATRLLFTAYSDLKAVVDAINEGSIFRYVTKPWDPDLLQSIVRQAVEQHDLIVERARLIEELSESNRRLVESDRLKTAFIEVASHELNTPVAVVLGMAQLWKLAQGDNATPAERYWVDRIHTAGKRLAGTVERILKLTRAGELRATFDPRPTPLEPLVRNVAVELMPFLDARRQRLDVEVEAGLGEAEVDPGKVADILTNLLINAVKFTPDGGTIRVVAGPEGPDQVRLAVTDQGPGIDPAVRDYVFEPFFTGFDTMHHSSGEFEYRKRGMGLGLCLVKRFVEMHGGTVELTSAPGGGSTFAIVLPRRPFDRTFEPANGHGLPAHREPSRAAALGQEGGVGEGPGSS